MLIKLHRNIYYWKYRTKFKIYFNTYNVTDMTDKTSNLVKNGKFRDPGDVNGTALTENRH